VKAKAAAACRHLGEPTGEARPCRSCGGKERAVPLRACAVYGACAEGSAVTLADGTPVRPCTTLCPGYDPGDAAGQGAAEPHP
jgi:hypothetical protein